jgi:hypothetical protein
MSKTYRIELSEAELFQALDGLELRAEAWEKTANYLRTGRMPKGEFFIIEECSDANEAEQIGKTYRSIIGKIREQIEKQRA